MKYYITCFCALLGVFNTAFSQSDTIKWKNYLYISTRTDEGYVYEYQDNSGKTIISQGKYCYLSKPDEHGFIIARKKTKDCFSKKESTEGYIDIFENILIPFNYSDIGLFHQNLVWAKKDNKIGYLNRNGKTAINFIYGGYENFYEDGVVVQKRNNKDVLLDTLGHEIINANHSYQSIKENFPRDHYLWIKKNGKFAFFDTKGKQLTPFEFDEMYPANLCDYKPNQWFCKELQWFLNDILVVEKDNQFAIINTQMQHIVPFGEYEWISPQNKNGIFIVKQNGKYGLLNYELKLIQPIEYNEISNTPAKVHEQNYPSFLAQKANKYFILDTLGQWIDKIEYDNVQKLKANFYLADYQGKQVRLDRNGIVLQDKFTFVRDGRMGIVVRRDSLYALVWKDGTEILPFIYEDIIEEHFGNIYVKKNGKWGVVDDENEQLVECKYDYIQGSCCEKEDNYIVVKNDKFGKITEDGVEIFPCIYDGVTTWVEYGPDGHYVMQENKMGLIDYKGNVLVPIEYDKVEHYWATSWVEVYHNGKIGLYDTKQKTFVLPLEYDCIIIDKDVWDFSEDKKPTRIITLKDNVVNILDEKFKVLQHNVNKEKIEKEYDIKINSGYSLCSYPLSLMKHNRTYSPPECLVDFYKTYDIPIEEIYYKMEVNE